VTWPGISNKPIFYSLFGFEQPACDLWQGRNFEWTGDFVTRDVRIEGVGTVVGPAMITYLQEMEVLWTSLDPIRMGPAGTSRNPVIIWVRVSPNSLTADLGIQVAIGCHSVLVDNSMDDVHVEIQESEATHSAQMYKPVITSNWGSAIPNLFASVVTPHQTSETKSANDLLAPTLTLGLHYSEKKCSSKLLEQNLVAWFFLNGLVDKI
jgi:hypothetical protein